MLNQCNFIGRLGKDPETRYLADGTAVTNFSIACSEKYKDKEGQQQEKTEWINLSAFARLGEVCGQYLNKGSLVYVSGKFSTRQYQDNDGKTCYSTSIRIFEMKMLDSRGSQQEQQAPAQSQQQAPQQQAQQQAPQQAQQSYQQQAPQQRPPFQPQQQPQASASGGFDDFDDDLPF